MRRLAVPALLLALAATACEPTEMTRVGDGVVELTVRDYRYDRQKVSVAPGLVVFNIVNAGSEPTNFRVRRKQRDVVVIATLEPGETGRAAARLKPGEYVMYSSVGRHETLGEHGTLIVTPDS